MPRCRPRASAAPPRSPRRRRQPTLRQPLSSTNARLVAARRLTRRSARRETGRFLAEGAQAVREALAAGLVVESFATAEAFARQPDLTGGADLVSAKDAAALSETVTPQGLIAVCRADTPGIDDVLARRPQLLVVLIEPNDPGNVGTVIRTADAAGADAVVLVGGVDAHNGKAVRASAGSVFHLPIVHSTDRAATLVDRLAADLTCLATTGEGRVDLDTAVDDGLLVGPTAWFFGAEAHGLPQDVLDRAAHTIRVPIRGRAESLNLAAAVAVCLYASAREQTRTD